MTADDEEHPTKKAKSGETPALTNTDAKTAAGAGEPTAAATTNTTAAVEVSDCPEEPKTTDPAAVAAAVAATAATAATTGTAAADCGNHPPSDNKDAHEQGSGGGGGRTTAAGVPTCLLCPLVLDEIHRLGGKWEPPSLSSPVAAAEAEADEQESSSSYEIDGHRVPLPMGQFLFEIQGLTKKTYKGSYEPSGLSVWDLTMGFAFSLTDEEVPISNRNDRKLVCFGMADGGNYFLVLDLDDSDPTDPQVYKVDHSDPDQCLYDWVTLREFLRELEVET